MESIQCVFSLNKHFKSLWLQSETSTGAIRISSVCTTYIFHDTCRVFAEINGKMFFPYVHEL